jgi:glycosyltransferase involved in cell wall biosynthesis/SAM-dependent methyltransferase
MHVLIVSHYLPPHVGGIEILVSELASHLRDQGHRVTLVSSAVGAGPADAAEDVHRVPAWNILEERLHVPFPIFSPSILAVMRKAVREADVVHAHGVLYLGSLLALLFCWWYDKPLVVTEHVGFVPYSSNILNAIQRTVLRLLTPLFLRHAQAMITYNRRVYDWLHGFAIHPERIFYTVNGIDTSIFRPADADERQRARRRLGVETGAPLALFVGRFVQKKRPDLMLRSGAASFDILMCGFGDLPDVPCASEVHVLRSVPHRDMPEVYRAADIMVLPSCGEGFPVAIMEAMACGLPVVACADPAYDDYVVSDELVQVPSEASAIRAELERLAADSGERRRRSELARRRAVEAFSMQRSTEQHLEIYRGAIETVGLETAFAPLGYDLPTQFKLPALRSIVRRPEGTPRLDVGPGTGYLANALLAPGSIVVVDVAHRNLVALRDQAHSAGAPARFLPVRADLMHLPFRNGAFGTAVCTQVLEHVEEDRRAASELARTVAPGGQIIVEVPHVGAGYASHLENLGIQTVHDVPGPEYHCRPGYTIDTLRRTFSGTATDLKESAVSVGRLGMIAIDTVSVVHLLYQRLRYGRSSWTWADVGEMAGSPVLRAYRLLFPFFRIFDLLDRAIGIRTGFILAARFEKTGAAQPQSRSGGASS